MIANVAFCDCEICADGFCRDVVWRRGQKRAEFFGVAGDCERLALACCVFDIFYL